MLSGLRALDLADEKGFICGKILAELGADVIKIEKPGGDPARNIGPFYHDTIDPEKSLYWFAYNSSKRGITLNIELHLGAELFKRMVSTADIVIESFPPGYMDSLGLGYQELSEINPEVIVASITPFGQTGPYRDYQASDLSLMALSGITSISGYPDRAPLRLCLEQSYCLSGTHAAIGIMNAIYYRRRFDVGQYIDVSMYECLALANSIDPVTWECTKQLLGRVGDRLMGQARQVWRCKDGYITWTLMGGEDEIKLLKGLIERMDEENMAGFLKSLDWSSVHISELSLEQIKLYEEVIAAFFLKHTKKELEQLSQEKNLRLAVIHDIDDVAEGDQLSSRQLASRGYWKDVFYPELCTTIKSPGFLFLSTETQTQVRFRAPLIGEHNDEIYEKELCLSKEEISQLKKQGVI
jgi:crotonobetainyl-CoA:carnitine CoA-transferase CaiB-like acyl-CoA transferase